MRNKSTNSLYLARLAVLCALSALCSARPAWAVLVRSGNGNTDGASLTAAGGPGDPLLPGFVNVGKGSTGETSVTYLGGGWVLTAGHVTIDNMIGGNPTPIHFGAGAYQADMSSIHYLHNANGTLADLKLFRLTTDPGLPSLIPLINDGPTTGRLIMIGNGLSAGAQHYWNADRTSVPWQWTETGPPAVPAINDYSGFDITYDDTGHRVIRWGENQVLNNDVVLHTFDLQDGTPLYAHGFTTAFDDQKYTGVTPLPSEAQGTVGDSGGAVFSWDENGQLRLSGIMVAAFSLTSNAPASTALFGDQTLSIELALYRDEILAIVPEPSSGVLAVLATVGLALARRRRKVCRSDFARRQRLPPCCKAVQ